MDRLASVSSLPTSKKRSRSSSSPRISSSKCRKVEDWIECTVASQQSFSKASIRRAESDSGICLSAGLERQDPITVRKRPQLTKRILGPTVSDLPSDPKMSGNSSSILSSGESTDSEKAIEPTHPKYQDCLEKRGVRLEVNNMYRPANLEELKDMMSKARDTPGPSAKVAADFSVRAVTCENEDGAKSALLPLLLPIIQKFWDNPTVDSPFLNKTWGEGTLLSPDLRPKITPPQPDQIFGFKGAVFPYAKATTLLEPYIVPTSRLAWPYFSHTTLLNAYRSAMNAGRVHESEDRDLDHGRYGRPGRPIARGKSQSLSRRSSLSIAYGKEAIRPNEMTGAL